MGTCRNPKLWLAVGAVAVVLALTTASFTALLPLLVLAACPLSMLLMAGGMAGMARKGRDAGNAEDDELARLRAEVADLRQRVDR